MAANDRTEGLLAAIRSTLLSDSELLSIVGSTGVVQNPEPAKPLPFIAMGDVQATDSGSGNTDAELVTLRLHIWAKSGSVVSVSGSPMLVSIRIAQRIRSLLHTAPLSLSGLVFIRVEQATGLLPDPDPNIAHQVVTVSALVGHETLI